MCIYIYFFANKRWRNNTNDNYNDNDWLPCNGQ